jgi:serine protease
MKTKLLILLFFIKLINLNAQKSDHFKGQFIVQLSESDKLSAFLSAFPLFDSKQNPPDQLAPTMPIYRLFFDEKNDEKALLEAVKKHPSVISAQYNHIIEDRATPNDTKYSSQWHHNNTGANAGLADADIDTDDAWNITKGGATTDGDSIVVAVIDNGTNLSHPDLQQNLWFNRQEIPDNGIDDDRNGFIDDYRGWNAAFRTDNVDAGTHGVEVEGVIGAVGNNNRGVAGVNWSVKIMSVVYDGSEASVIAGYGYVIAQRKLYNQSNGRRGAFVVATNSSFGAPNRFARDAPVWCAMYDTLGSVGILNIGATANNNIDVDAVGDLPSTCPSDYLVVVTATDTRDVKATDAAFGVVNVDVAAPGVGIWTTAANGDYTAARGTSLACPMVAGIAALAYSAPCSDFTNFAKTNPSGAALLLKNWILQGAESKPDLLDKIKTGARVNAFNTVQKVVQYCGSCAQPSKVQVATTTTTATVSMAFSGGPISPIAARYRLMGSTTWTSISVQTPPLSITGLGDCSNYEIEIKTNCIGSSSTALVVPFKTGGCCNPPDNVLITNVLNNQLTIQTPRLTAALGYQVCMKESKTGICVVNKFYADSTFIVNNLKPCQPYLMLLHTVCANGVDSRDTFFNLKTKGCGACNDSVYCRSTGSTANEWIDSFSIADFKFYSRNNGGFAKFDTTIAVLERGKTYPISLKPGYSGTAFQEGARVWIDLNQDGDFEDTGEQIAEFPRFTATVSGSITIPLTAINGTTRLRVGMKYVGFSGTPSTACESFTGGEVEDYCVQIGNRIPTQEIGKGDVFDVYPNPFTQFLTIKNKNKDSSMERIELFSLDGRVLFTKKIESNVSDLVLSDLPPLSTGMYFLKIKTTIGIFVAKVVRN